MEGKEASQFFSMGTKGSELDGVPDFVHSKKVGLVQEEEERCLMEIETEKQLMDQVRLTFASMVRNQ